MAGSPAGQLRRRVFGLSEQIEAELTPKFSIDNLKSIFETSEDVRLIIEMKRCN